ncbi:MAG TPA: hypothetical protein PK370_01065 [Candidatus Woesebacteria bacterium]|nr:hypothetical protein [Candidatus Woesebacteria bacterium]HPJ17471.1 hypothetical protein [Candidatus Woesebacteria bacterium]
MESRSIQIKIIGLIVGIGLIATGLVWYWQKGDLKEIKNRMVEVKKVGDGSYELTVGKEGKKISMVEMKAEVVGNKIEKFDLNEKVFNLELMNKIQNKTKMEVIGGITKATKDLPEGKVVIGEIVTEGRGGEINFEEIKITYGSEAGTPIVDMITNYKLKLK